MLPAVSRSRAGPLWSASGLRTVGVAGAYTGGNVGPAGDDVGPDGGVDANGVDAEEGVEGGSVALAAGEQAANNAPEAVTPVRARNFRREKEEVISLYESAV